jgi:hypothetical protein
MIITVAISWFWISPLRRLLSSFLSLHVIFISCFFFYFLLSQSDQDFTVQQILSSLAGFKVAGGGCVRISEPNFDRKTLTCKILPFIMDWPVLHRMRRKFVWQLVRDNRFSCWAGFYYAYACTRQSTVHVHTLCRNQQRHSCCSFSRDVVCR